MSGPQGADILRSARKAFSTDDAETATDVEPGNDGATDAGTSEPTDSPAAAPKSRRRRGWFRRRRAKGAIDYTPSEPTRGGRVERVQRPATYRGAAVTPRRVHAGTDGSSSNRSRSRRSSDVSHLSKALRELASLHNEGVIDDSEFTQLKADLIRRNR